jgi:hypothetical protein
MYRYKYGLVIAFLLFFFQPAGAETVTISASRDTTLIEDPAGAFSNGYGPYFFVGRTNQVENGIRRGLLLFDVAVMLPPEAIIESVSLTLYQYQGNPGVGSISLHRVQDNWGEGASASSGGQGAPSQPGDATWTHTFYPSDFWVREGGHFVERVSSEQNVDGTGYYTWESASNLVNDVRLWLRTPDKNCGWIFIGDEVTPQTVKRFASRENPDILLRPMLKVIYRLPKLDGGDQLEPSE